MKKIKEIFDAYESQTNQCFIDGVFDEFLDNNISAEEFAELLKMKDIPLNEDFLSLAPAKQRSYFSHKTTHVIKEAGNMWDIKEREHFNPEYFYTLADYARKSHTGTKFLLSYIRKLCIGKFDPKNNNLNSDVEPVNNYNLLPLLLSYVYNENIGIYDIGYKEDLSIYADNHGKTLYSLIINLFNEPDNSGEAEKDKLVKESRERLTAKLKFDSVLGLDITKLESRVKFMFLIETVLYQLEKKDANTLKVCFNILKAGDLKEDDYYIDSRNRDRIKKAFRKRISEDAYEIKHPTSHDAGQKIVKRTTDAVKDFVKAYPEIVKNDNGYTALYHTLIED